MATMVRWAPFSELASMHNEMSRFMNGLLEGNGRTSQSWVPVADVWETEKEVRYAFHLPRKPEDNISVAVDDTPRAVPAGREREHKRADGRCYSCEPRDGTFPRTTGLRHGGTEDSSTAEYAN